MSTKGNQVLCFKWYHEVKIVFRHWFDQKFRTDVENGTYLNFVSHRLEIFVKEYGTGMLYK